MAQLSLYMDEMAMESLRADAAQAGMSISSYAREVLETRHDAGRAWPDGYWESVYGSLTDPTFVVPEELDPALDGPVPVF